MASDKEEIINRLQEHMSCIINQGCDPHRILGIFLYGSQNHGFTDAQANVNSIIVTLPTFEAVCLNATPVSKEYGYGPKKERIQLKDIRLYRQMLLKQDVSFLETLFTDYSIVNPDYLELFQRYLIENNEKIAHLDVQNASMLMGKQITSLVTSSPINAQTLYDANRLYICLRNYLAEKPFLECIQPEDKEKDFLIQIKQRKSPLIKDPTALNNNIHSLQFQVQSLLEDSDTVESIDQKAARHLLDRGIVEIMRASFNQDPIEESGITAQQFLDELTKKEKKAYNIITFETRGQGNVVLSQVIKKYGVGRNTFNQVLHKIKLFNVGTTLSQGGKGIYVEITHPELRKMAQNRTGIED